MKIKTIALAGVAGLALSAAAIGSASADPSGAPTFRALAGVGSDTTQDVLNGLSNVVKDASGTKLIGSYDATGGGNIQTKAASNCTFARPVGSGAGRTALLNSTAPGSPTAGCVDFARSSALNLAATPAGQGLTYIPFAVDAVTYATAAGSTIPRNLTKAQLTAIYTCDPSTAGIKPLLPQANSGTRAFWLKSLGLTETTKGACVQDTVNNVSITENDGRVLTDPAQIIPFSVAQYIAQSFGAASDIRGQATLGAVDGITPVALNTAFSIKRDVYNIVPTANLGTSPTSDVFVGPQSKVCSNTAVIQQYGFGINPNCGSTTNQTPTG
ncbi:MAG: substrate-binding domain-containing protein [Mycobacteriales bacterium]